MVVKLASIKSFPEEFLPLHQAHEFCITPNTYPLLPKLQTTAPPIPFLHPKTSTHLKLPSIGQRTGL